MGKKKGGRGGGRSSRSSKSRSRSSGRSTGGSSSSSSSGGGSKSGGGGRSSGRSSSSAGSSGSRSGSSGSRASSVSSGVSSSVSSQKTASVSSTSPSMSSSISGMGTATTSAVKSSVQTPVASSTYGSFIGPSGKVTKIKGVDPSSAEGKTIQATYDRQRMVKALNKSKQNMTAAMRGAKNAQEANQIRAKFIAANPALTSAGDLRTQTARVNKALQTGFTNLGPTGEPIGVTTPRTALYDSKGNQVGSTTGHSVGAKADFFETQKQTKATTDFFGVSTKTAKPEKTIFDMTTTAKPSESFLAMPTMSVKPQPDDSQFLSESQKAFGFLPSPSEIKGTDPFSELGQGALKGSSNVMASFWNIGETVRSTATGTEANPVKYYGTPITRAELTFFGVAEKGITSATGGDAYSFDMAGSDVQKGLGKAGKEFQTDFFGSVGSLVEAGPYIIGGGISKGIQTGARLGTNFFGKASTTALKKSDDIMGSGGVKVSKTDYFSGFFRDTKRGLGVGTTKTGKVTKAKFKKDSLDLGRGLGMQGTPKQATTGFFGKTTTPKKLTKKAYDDSTGKNFFTSGKGQQLIQVAKTEQKALTKTKLKTKQITKVKATTAQNFFGKVKTVPKLKTKVKTKAKTKQKYMPGFVPLYKQTAKVKPVSKLKQRAKQAALFGIPAASTAITTSTLFPPTTTGSGGGGFAIPRRLRGRRGSGGNMKRKGKKGFYGWNINIKKVGSTYSGPAYVTSKNALDIDRYLSAKGKKAKKGKAFGSNGADFFG